MFELYTEKARRSIFFARYEASQLGSHSIAPVHLLLGLLREDRVLRDRLPHAADEKIRKRVEEAAQPVERFWTTAVDMPLSPDCRKALTLAGEERAAMQHKLIDCSHLVLGVLHIETAAALLREYGIEYANYREGVTEPAAPAAPEIGLQPPDEAFTGPLAESAARMQRLLPIVRQLPERGPRLKRAGWTRKEALGHLIDWAAAHQQWFAQALAEPHLTARGYPDSSWPAAQHYEEMDWQEIVDLCVSLHRLMVHVIARIPEGKLDTACRIGIWAPMPLQELVRRYVAHCEDIVAQLSMRG